MDICFGNCTSCGYDECVIEKERKKRRHDVYKRHYEKSKIDILRRNREYYHEKSDEEKKIINHRHYESRKDKCKEYSRNYYAIKKGIVIR